MVKSHNQVNKRTTQIRQLQDSHFAESQRQDHAISQVIQYKNSGGRPSKQQRQNELPETRALMRE